MTNRFTYPLKAVALAAIAFFATGCEEEDNENLQGNWVDTYRSFPGTPRGGAVSFEIELDGEKCVFIGTGANTNKTEELERFRDFYCARPGEDGMPTWTSRYEKLYSKDDERAPAGTVFFREDATYKDAVASMPMESRARNGAVGFAINGKGYVGLGFDGNDFLRDFWCYDPQTNSWEKAPTYPGDGVRYATCFVIDNIAYVGSGEDFDNNIVGDFYKFDGKSWTPIQTIGQPRSQATAFVHNGYGYVFGGVSGGAVVTAFQRYNPAKNAWENLRQLKDQSRNSYDDQYGSLATSGSTSFVLNEGTPDAMAYVTTGGRGYAGTATWEYNPNFDYWVQKTSFEGSPRKFAISFVLNAVDIYGQGPMDVAYVCTGSSNDMSISGSGGNFYQDTWMWQPQAPYERRD